MQPSPSHMNTEAHHVRSVVTELNIHRRRLPFSQNAKRLECISYFRSTYKEYRKLCATIPRRQGRLLFHRCNKKMYLLKKSILFHQKPFLQEGNFDYSHISQKKLTQTFKNLKNQNRLAFHFLKIKMFSSNDENGDCFIWHLPSFGAPRSS
jgi:hypothetical protein